MYFQLLSLFARDLTQKIQLIHTPQDAVRLVRSIATDSTDELVDRLCDATRDLDDTTLTRLSRLYQFCAKDGGEHGYAMTLLWTCVLTHREAERRDGTALASGRRAATAGAHPTAECRRTSTRSPPRPSPTAARASGTSNA